MIHVRSFGLQCSEDISAYARLIKFNPSILHVQNWLAPLYVNVELITPDHHVVSQHEELLQRCILRENTYTLKFTERSSYNTTIELRKIRCIKDKHHMKSISVIWYGHHHLVPLISISKVPSWSHRHRHDTMISIILIFINVLSHGRLANYRFCNYCYRIVIK